MKSILYAILFLLTPKIASSQALENNELTLSPNDKFYYLDSTSIQTNSKNYLYIRVIKDSKLKKESYIVEEYYRSGSLRMQGTSKKFDGYFKEGNATYYYKNGNKKSEGEYINDKNQNTSLYKINQFWDVNGVQKVIDGNGFFEATEENEHSKGELKNGFKEGTWEGYLVDSKIEYKEIYNNGKFVSGTSTNKNGIQASYDVLDKKPEPKGGIMNFYQYVGKNYKTPNVQGLKGKIYVSFVVDVDGKIIEPKVLRDLGYGTGLEALRILANYHDFIPGERRGQKVKCFYSLPISIQTAN